MHHADRSRRTSPHALRPSVRMRLSDGLAIALIVFVAFAQPGAAQGDGGAGGTIFALIFWLLVGAAVAWFMVRNRSPFELQTTTSLSPDEAIESAERALVVAGWQVVSKRSGAATFRAETKGSCLVALLLLLIGLIPGILYLAFRGRTMTIDVSTTPAASGTVVRFQGSTQGFGGKAAAESALKALPTSSIASISG
jgi:hypothetical protein